MHLLWGECICVCSRVDAVGWRGRASGQVVLHACLDTRTVWGAGACLAAQVGGGLTCSSRRLDHWQGQAGQHAARVQLSTEPLLLAAAGALLTQPALHH